MGPQRPRNKGTRFGLTERQAHWVEHLRACESSGLTSKAYAKKHRLSVHALYQARKEFRRRAALASPPNKPSVTFTKVHADPRVARVGLWRVRFRNGSILEFEAPREPGERADLLQAVASLS